MEFIIEKRENKWKNLFVAFLLAFFAILSFYAGYRKNISRFELLKLKDLPEDNYILVFYQPSCPHCIEELPILLELKEKENLKIHSINILEERRAIEEYDIKATPTIILRFNQRSMKIEGKIEKEKLLKLIEKLKEGKTQKDENLSFERCSVEEEMRCEAR